MVTLENILFWRMPNTSVSGPDHVLSYLAILVTLVFSGIFYYKHKLPKLLLVTDAILIIGMGTWYSDINLYKDVWAYLWLGSSSLSPLLVEVVGVGLILKLFLLKQKKIIAWFGLYSLIYAIPFVIWMTVLNSAVDFVNHTPTQYWMVPWVSEWEIGVWVYACVFYYLIVVRHSERKENK